MIWMQRSPWAGVGRVPEPSHHEPGRLSRRLPSTSGPTGPVTVAEVTAVNNAAGNRAAGQFVQREPAAAAPAEAATTLDQPARERAKQHYAALSGYGPSLLPQLQSRLSEEWGWHLQPSAQPTDEFVDAVARAQRDRGFQPADGILKAEQVPTILLRKENSNAVHTYVNYLHSKMPFRPTWGVDLPPLDLAPNEFAPTPEAQPGPQVRKNDVDWIVRTLPQKLGLNFHPSLVWTSDAKARPVKFDPKQWQITISENILMTATTAEINQFFHDLYQEIDSASMLYLQMMAEGFRIMPPRTQPGKGLDLARQHAPRLAKKLGVPENVSSAALYDVYGVDVSLAVFIGDAWGASAKGRQAYEDMISKVLRDDLNKDWGQDVGPSTFNLNFRERQ